MPHAALATRLGRFVAASAKFSLGTAVKRNRRRSRRGRVAIALAWNTNLSFIFGKVKSARENCGKFMCAHF